MATLQPIYPVDIIYKHLTHIDDGEVKFTEKHLPLPTCEELDELAKVLRLD